MRFFEHAVLHRLLIETRATDSAVGHTGCAVLLHVMYRQCRSGTGVDVVVSRRALSDAIGIARNTMNKTIAACQDHGWLTVTETAPRRKDSTRMSVKVPAVLMTKCCAIMAEELEHEAVQAVATGCAFSARDFIDRYVKVLTEHSVLLGHEQETIDFFASEIRCKEVSGSNLSRRKIQRGSNLSHSGSNLSHLNEGSGSNLSHIDDDSGSNLSHPVAHHELLDGLGVDKLELD